MTKTALVLGGGGLLGAYTAGVSAELGRQLGPDYFEKAHASSVGVFMGAFYVSNQPEVIEMTWRNHVNGTKLVEPSFANFLKRNAMKLEYLERIFQADVSQLDLDAAFAREGRLSFVLTDLKTGEPVYHAPNRTDVFRAMSASCSWPGMRKAIALNGSHYLDGCIGDPLPVANALNGEDSRVCVVSNFSPGFSRNRLKKDMIEKMIALGYLLIGYVPTAGKINSYATRLEGTLQHCLDDPRVDLIAPSRELPLLSALDTDTERLNDTIDLGIKDAKTFLDRLVKR